MASFDPLALDQQLSAQLDRQRAALATLWRDPEGAPPARALHSRVLSERSSELVAASSEPFKDSAHAWLLGLRAQLHGWPLLRDLARGWSQPQRVVHLDRDASPAELRRLLLSSPSRGLQVQHGDALAGISHGLARTTQRRLHEHWAELRERGHATPLQVARVPADAAVSCARSLLSRSADVAHDQLPRSGWVAGIAAALGRDADEGWPARLTTRWLSEVIGPSEMARGLRPKPGPLPKVYGALSFARALGQLGEALLLAARPASLPRYAQLHPYGMRRHRQRALFATLVLEPAFAERVLGLGAGRRARQRRGCATALLQSLRLEAMRVVLVDALATGIEPAHERFEAVSVQLFGQPAPPSLLGVLPALHHATSGAALLGSLLSAHDRDELVDSCDEDWFRNPAAGELLRARAAQAQQEQPLAEDRLPTAIERLISRLEAVLA